MNRYVVAISNRLSLRPPQRESLEILSELADLLSLDKQQDAAEALQKVKAVFPHVRDFEREFPSLCFALATGVGKTRLMGAFVAYLHLAHGIRHFFVLAPNLTIYNKLIADFTPGNKKYVLQGIAEFVANPPEVITGDNYESGRGVRAADLFGEIGIHINIFNISKINSEVRGGKAPRIKRLQEYIGQSYFDYLAGLDDLVLLMDESHRYRASAGVKALNDLKPILGLELTATPQVEASGGSIPFKNVIYSYPLSSALADGFVKEPVVATRENFQASSYTAEELQRLKLEDGVRIHESVKVELETFARQNDMPIVKPFMLVVAQDVEQAKELVEIIKQDDFFNGRYKERVITVHSNQSGEEKDETVERLLAVENPYEPTEIVVHVNMLKEGWDVTNLYTIVPLRAANSKTLVEQSIGRGLRLPYGKRMDVKSIDRLTIVAHDKFQEIIDDANNPHSIIKTGVIIGRDIAKEPTESVVARPRLDIAVQPTLAETGEQIGATQQTLVFPTPAEQKIAQVTMEVIRNYERLPRSQSLTAPDVQAEIVKAVTAISAPAQAALEGIGEKPDIAAVVAKAVDLFIENSIDIPRITVLPTGEVTSGYKDFDLKVDIAPQPVSSEILLAYLRTNERERLVADSPFAGEERFENFLVRRLWNYNDISYDRDADLLYKLAGQMVAHLRSYLPDEESVLNVLRFNERNLGEFIHAQMQENYWECATSYEASVAKGFTRLRENNYTKPAGEPPVNFRAPVEEKQYIRSILFGGFKRCLYQVQKFDSDPERRFSVLLEDDGTVLKWFKPAKGQMQIFYKADQSYEPDFVVETSTAMLLCEPKRANEMTDPEVLAKARAAITWCKHASDHAQSNGGKPWSYLLMPHDAITASSTLDGLEATYRRVAV